MSTKKEAKKFFDEKFGPMTFGTYLTGIRLNLGLSQSDLARRLKVSRSMVCDIEKGRVLVSPALAVKIARGTKFPVQLAVKYCLEDQLRKAKIKMHVTIDDIAS